MSQYGLALSGVRQTSVATYRQIEAEGLLSRVRWAVYRHLFHHGPLTGRELDAALARDGETRTSYHKRLSELERMRVVSVVGERACRVTGRVAVLWDVTLNLPEEPPRRVKTDWEAIAKQLQAEVEGLRAQLRGGAS